MARKIDNLNFENALAELETIVQKMESGDLTLEESLQAFEQGIKLTKECQKALKSAEQKVNKLLSKDDKFELEPFSPQSDNNQ